MTQRTGDTQTNQRIATIHRSDGAAQSDDCVELEQRDRRGGAIQIDLAGLDGLCDARRDRCRVHLETNLQRGGGTHRALDDFIHPRGVGPELLVAECFVPEDLLTCRRGLLDGGWNGGALNSEKRSDDESDDG